MISLRRIVLIHFLVICLLEVIKTDGEDKDMDNVQVCIEQIENDLGNPNKDAEHYNIEQVVTYIMLNKNANSTTKYYSKNYLQEVGRHISPDDKMLSPTKYCESLRIIERGDCNEHVVKSYRYFDIENLERIVRDILYEKKIGNINLPQLDQYIIYVVEHTVISKNLLNVEDYCKREMKDQIQYCVTDINNDIGAFITDEDKIFVLKNKKYTILITFFGKFYFSEIRDNIEADLKTPTDYCNTYSEDNECRNQLVLAGFVDGSSYTILHRAFYEITLADYDNMAYVVEYLDYISLHFQINEKLPSREEFCSDLILFRFEIPTKKVESVLKRNEILHTFYEEEKEENTNALV